MRCSFDAIMAYGYGVELDSQSERSNVFYVLAAKNTTIKFKQLLALHLANSMPWLLKQLRIKFLRQDFENLFKKLVRDTIENREKTNIKRADFIDLLKDAKKVMPEDEVIYQGVLLLFGSIDVIALTISHLLYEMALNPEIQKKLVTEIKETYAKTGGRIDFNIVQEMKYLNMVVSETLRKYALSTIERMCTKDYNLGKPNNKATRDYILRKGDFVLIPMWAIHYNPEYYPDPQKFDPERFSDENKHKIKPYSYAPFGLGPRNCIANRFAICEIKVITCQLLEQIEVLPGPRTPVAFQLDPGTFTIDLKGDHCLWYKLRE